MPYAPDLTGVALEDRYELHALIGEGTFGRVYRGRDRRLARRVAVKVIKPWWAEDPDWVRSFEREAQLLASISDPGIVQIYDVGTAPQGLYYVAELVDGQSLADRLGSGPLPAAEACDVAEQLARALARAHAQRVVHRDVKPANVLITDEGRVKVGDFGVARLAESTTDGGVATIVGTPRYMAPEQARGGPTGPATDVYGVGVVLYEMLAGRPPFVGSSAVELALQHVNDPPPPLPEHTPRALAGVVGRALAKDPAARYADGGELAQALAAARPASADQQAPSWATTAAVGMLSRPRTATAATSVMAPPAAAVRDRPPAPPADLPAATRVGDPLAPRRNLNPSERRQRLLLLACVLAIALGIVFAAFALAPGDVKVPQLRGMARTRVAGVLRHAHLRGTYTSRYSEAPRNTAIAQSPPAGRRVGEDATVRVVFSAGPPPVAVPRLLGRTSGEAESTLSRLRLRGAVSAVPAPGTAPGTVTAQSPGAGATVPRGSTVALSVAETPQWRPLTSLAGDHAARSVPFRIRGKRWQIVYRMGYEGTCTFVFICSGPTATVTNLSSGATVDQFDLGEGSGETHSFTSGPGVFQISVSPGSDTARWAVKVDDYY